MVEALRHQSPISKKFQATRLLSRPLFRLATDMNSLAGKIKVVRLLHPARRTRSQMGTTCCMHSGEPFLTASHTMSMAVMLLLLNQITKSVTYLMLQRLQPRLATTLPIGQREAVAITRDCLTRLALTMSFCVRSGHQRSSKSPLISIVELDHRSHRSNTRSTLLRRACRRQGRLVRTSPLADGHQVQLLQLVRIPLRQVVTYCYTLSGFRRSTTSLLMQEADLLIAQQRR